jgi:hypothetical protein
MKKQMISLAVAAAVLSGCATPTYRPLPTYTPSPTSVSTYQGPTGWTYVTSDTDGGDTYVYYSTIRRDGNHVTFWSKVTDQCSK